MLTKDKSAKYSVIIATENISLEETKSLLLNGLKVILFVSESCIKAHELELGAYEKAGFLNLYTNANNLNVIIKDGKNVDLNILQELENADSRFNLEQYVIEHEDSGKNLIVEAGAGTGKTHVMINRIMYLMHTDSEFDFSKVAMITFTNKATDNMRHRLINTLDMKYKLTGKKDYLDRIEELSQISISTIHSFFKKVIIEVGPTLGYGTNIRLKSYIQEKKELLRNLLNNQYKGTNRVEDVIGLPMHQIETLALEYWEKLDNNGISEDEIQEIEWGNASDDKAKLIQQSLMKIFYQVDEEYNKIKYINNAISMKDIIHELSRVINKPELKDYISKNYNYMFCDEFQDSDNVQIQTIAILNRVYEGNLFVVGDIKQSIYRFRGATDSAFLKLNDLFTEEEKEKLVVKSLTKNYRTSQHILCELDEIFSAWGPSQLDLLKYEQSDRLVPQVNKSGIYLQRKIKSDERKKAVIETIKDIQENSEYKKITCLTRKNSQLRTIKRWCEEEKIVCIIKERGSFFTSDAVLDFCALIEAYLYDNEPMYLYNYILSAYGSGYVNYESLKKSEGDKCKIFETLLKETNISQWDMYRTELKNKPVMAVLREMVSNFNPVSNYGIRKKAELIRKGYPEKKAIEQAVIDATQYEANLKKLLQILTDQFSGDFSSLVDLCDYLRLKIMTDSTEELADVEDITDINYIEGLTVHGSKGLEFENVLLPYMNDPFYQRFRSEIIVSRDRKRVGWVYRKKDEDDIKNDNYAELLAEEDNEVAKEETRLLYVAMTRAIYGLYCFPERKKKGTNGPMSWADLIPEEKDNAKNI